MKKEQLFAEVLTSTVNGIYKVKEIIGSIVCVEVNGRSYDCYLTKGEVLRFCTEDHKNYRFTNI